MLLDESNVCPKDTILPNIIKNNSDILPSKLLSDLNIHQRIKMVIVQINLIIAQLASYLRRRLKYMKNCYITKLALTCKSNWLTISVVLETDAVLNIASVML